MDSEPVLRQIQVHILLGIHEVAGSIAPKGLSGDRIGLGPGVKFTS